MNKLLIICLTLAFVTITWARDPELELEHCQAQCKILRMDEQICRDKCQRQYEEQKQGRESEGSERGDQGEGRSEEEEREEQHDTKKGEPYVFQDEHFSTKLQTEHGKLTILQRFNKRSKLLSGIKNYRVAILKANPQTFVVPNHQDADVVIFVHQGRAAISLVWQDKRESYNIRRGDVFRIRAGTTVYIVNRDNNEELVMVKLIQPVSTPGRFEPFFGPGGENPESFFTAFTPELVEAALNTRRETYEKVFQQDQGVIIKASEEQIKGMSQKEEGGHWPFGSDKGPFNLFKQRPSQSNQHGKYYEVDQSEFKDLQELDLTVSFVNVSKGSMTAPMFNSKATKIAVVVSGEGSYLEIACPHVSSSRGQEEERGGRSRQEGGGSSQRQSPVSYQRVSANLRSGTVFVVPAGHPWISVASQNENLQVICFEVNAENNEKVQLAGRKNVINNFERLAKELAFGVSAKQVDEVFKSQEDEFFFKGPRQQSHDGHAST